MRHKNIFASFLCLLISISIFSQQEDNNTKIKEIQEVILKGQKPYIEQTANKISVNVSQSPTASTSNVYDILLQSPSVIELNGNLAFRSKSVSVLIDGKLTNLSGEDLKAMLSSMQGTTIDKIEILPNPSSKYDATGGSVINIKLLKNKKKGINGTLTTNTQIAQHLSHLPGATLNFKNKSLNIYSGYNYENSKQNYTSNSDQVLSPISQLFQNEYGTTFKNNHNYRLGADYDINKNNTIGFLFKGMNNRTTLSGSNDIELLNSSDLSLSRLKNNSKSKIFSPAANIYYKRVIDSLQRTMMVNLDYFEYGKNVDEDFVTQYFSNNISDVLLRDYASGTNKVYSAAVDFEYPSALGNFEFGLKTISTKSDNNILWENLSNGFWINDPSKSNQFIYNENIYAGYITYDKTLGDNWQVTLGLRGEQTYSRGNLIGGDQNDRNYFNLFPNVNIQYLKNLNNVFNINYRKSIQRFGFDVVNPFIRYQSEYAYFQGNPNIRPQINHSFDFSYTYRQRLTIGASETHSIDALGPLFTKNGETTVSTYTNFRSSDFFYIYASWNTTLFRIWTNNLVAGTGGYKFNTSTEDYISVNNNNSWAYLIQNNNSFKLKNNWAVQLDLTYQSALASGIFKQKGYFNSNVGVSKQLLDNKLSLKLAVSDIFNTMETRYSVDYNNILLNQTRKKETRFLTIGLTYKFGGGNSKSKESNDTFDDLEKRMKTEQ
ncbi:outer membrane beta-barrel family protein [Kaistella sp.]|uniref:outer membrane beta-barrel family protein n=1 Tax=Kaistella sp. TaxID=2782235 RepID=UPI0035A0A684